MSREKGIRFCTLYRLEQRTPREEAELSSLYPWAYDEAFRAVAHIARKAGFSDPDMLADTATTLLDFCCRGYDWSDTPKTLVAYFRNIAYAYLRKHRDFLSFSKRVVGCGYDQGDYLTRSVYGRPDEGRPKSLYVSPEADDVDLLADLSPDRLDPLYALEWENNGLPAVHADLVEDDEDDLSALSESLSLSSWVDLTISYIRGADLAPAILSMRTSRIVQQLQAVSGSPVADIAKRLISRAKGGCDIARALLTAMVSELDSRKNAGILAKILPVVAEASPAETVDLGLLIDTADLYYGRVPPKKPGVSMEDADVPPSLDDGEDDEESQPSATGRKRAGRRGAARPALAGFPLPSAQMELRLGGVA